MKMTYHVSVMLIVAAAIACNAVDDGSVLHTGEATFYGDGGVGNCGLPISSGAG